MKITKLGHCCLIVETSGIRIMTDPGNYSTKQNEAKDIDVILISHEHTDHLHIESLQQVLANNPEAVVYTNSSVGKLLDAAVPPIPYQIIEQGDRKEVKGASIEGFGKDHAPIYKELELVLNTGYMIDGRFFYPGDSFYVPSKSVEILALPIAGPWMKISEALGYAQAVKPKACIPVHDGNLRKFGGTHRHPKTVLEPLGISFIPMGEGDTIEI
ncbi:MAG: metal-dependent hydrolase [Candidatus Taylorbacteria bacterium]|nr:metal-dependent hydrolase [Candidatus Taylorbacteria bacterium]